MSDFKAKMHQIRFPQGLRPRPPIAAFKEPLVRGGRGKGMGGKRRGG